MSSGMSSLWTFPTPHHTTLHRTAPHHTTPHHTTPHHTTPHHTTPHHTTPHHTTLVCSCALLQLVPRPLHSEQLFFLLVLWSVHSSAEHTVMNAIQLAATQRSCGITSRPVERPHKCNLLQDDKVELLHVRGVLDSKQQEIESLRSKLAHSQTRVQLQGCVLDGTRTQLQETQYELWASQGRLQALQHDLSNTQERLQVMHDFLPGPCTSEQHSLSTMMMIMIMIIIIIITIITVSSYDELGTCGTSLVFPKQSVLRISMRSTQSTGLTIMQRNIIGTRPRATR